jgi:hypothetical protein
MNTDEDKLPTVDDTRFVTTDGAVALIHHVTGIPIPKSRFQKDSAAGIAPEPDAIYGKSYLYRPTRIIAYALSRIRRIRPPEVA